VRAQKVLTIEGLANQDGMLHPVQHGVIDEQGFQLCLLNVGIRDGHCGILKN